MPLAVNEKQKIKVLGCLLTIPKPTSVLKNDSFDQYIYEIKIPLVGLKGNNIPIESFTNGIIDAFTNPLYLPKGVQQKATFELQNESIMLLNVIQSSKSINSKVDIS